MYLNNTQLLQNTLLPYFNSLYPLIILNKQFSKLNYEKYNTHIQPHGIIETFYTNGNIKEHKNYVNGQLHGLYTEYYNTTPSSLCIIRTYKNHKENGLYEYWNQNGKLKIRCNYKNGGLDGLYEEYYRTGELMQRINYKNEKLNGLFEQWMIIVNYSKT